MMKLMELAVIVSQLDCGDQIDFASKEFGGLFGVTRTNPFDNDNLIYLVGRYNGECETWLYNISEYDGRRINCIAKMLADVFERSEGIIPEEITVDI